MVASRKPSRRALFATLAFLLFVFAGMMSASPASASSESSATASSSAAPSAATPYCSAELIPGGGVKNARCYSSKSTMASAMPNVETVISIDYTDIGYGGASFVWYISASACVSGGTTYFTASMPQGWNDVISSYQAYANCHHNPHYENNNYTGAVSNCVSLCTYIGDAMNDRTSSEKWYY